MAEALRSVDDAVAAAVGLVPATGRRLLGLTGPPGAGKSTLAEEISARLGDVGVVVPMDGFHLANDVLAERGLSNVKGAPETFDRDGLVRMLARLRSVDEVVRAPQFDRDREDVVPDAIEVAPSVRLVVVEGNYLLHWPDARGQLDEVWYVEPASDAARVDSLIARHVSFGRSAEDAAEWVVRNDENNARTVAADRGAADRIVTSW